MVAKQARDDHEQAKMRQIFFKMPLAESIAVVFVLGSSAQVQILMPDAEADVSLPESQGKVEIGASVAGQQELHL